MSSLSILLFSALFFTINISQTNAMSSYFGHWQKTWDVPSTRFKGANLGCAFSGWPDADSALRESKKVYNNLEGRKIITVGGGNRNGAWTSSKLQSVINGIRTGRFRSYSGIAFDIEEGDSGMTGQFLNAFHHAKRARLLVIVTITRTAPYGIEDARKLMHNILRSRNIDILSPMMYASGENYDQCSTRGGISTEPLKGVPWSWFRQSRAAVVPSIWKPRDYRGVRSFFRRVGIKTRGYITWCL